MHIYHLFKGWGSQPLASLCGRYSLLLSHSQKIPLLVCHFKTYFFFFLELYPSLSFSTVFIAIFHCHIHNHCCHQVGLDFLSPSQPLGLSPSSSLPLSQVLEILYFVFGCFLVLGVVHYTFVVTVSFCILYFLVLGVACYTFASFPGDHQHRFKACTY